MRILSLAWLACLASVTPGRAAEELRVQPVELTDQKAVFATVESTNVVPARARIGGTVAMLSIRQGEAVRPGQVIAIIGDEKLLLRIAALDAQIAAVDSQSAQARTDYERAETLFRQGSGTRVAMDNARTAMEVAAAGLQARTAERDVARQQLTEGQVLAPVAGRVLTVPVTTGTVILPGDTLASIAEGHYILRLRVPERHAGALHVGDPVRIDTADLPRASVDGIVFGKITLVYPKIEEGRVVADASVPGLGDYFVGERVRVWVGAGKRQGFVVPASYLLTRFGLDYVRLRTGAAVVEIPVRRGEPRPTQAMPDALEILSGLHAGDVLVQP